ncbi:MAG: biotin transporter BioY [Dehalococcoidaceae bacterium]|nr:biotin transporter BioY [Dehalococcoidaceae bacterium]
MSFLFFKNNNDKYPPLAQTLPMREQAIIKPLLLIFSGVLILWMTAQIRINLFFTPVPITGQTFGVLILAAAYGSRLGMTTILAYLFVGIAGLPVFAGASSGWSYFSGVTAGYLVGFAAAAYFVGYLSEMGWDRRPMSVIASMLIGNLIIYLFGVTWLTYSLGVGFGKGLSLGLEPFIIGDAIKILLAAGFLPGMWTLKTFFDN